MQTMNHPQSLARSAEAALDALLAAADRAGDLSRYGLYPDAETVCHGDGGTHITDAALADWLLAALFVRWVRARRDDERATREMLAREKAARARRGEFRAVSGSKGVG